MSKPVNALDSSKVTYPFPLRPDVVAELRLPVDLTLSEAERIAQFVASLAIDSKAPKPMALDDPETRRTTGDGW